MSRFTTRIELHNADPEDYIALHAHMTHEGFLTTIQSDGGTIYQLPPAEYWFQGGFTRAQVLEKAKRAATRTHRKFAALVTESAGSTWTGLQEEEPQRSNRWI